MIFTSQFSHSARQPNLCSSCHRPINKGDRVEWHKGARGQNHAVCGAEGQAIKKEIAKSYASESKLEIVCPEGLNYLPYQKAGIEFALRRKSTLIADEMGLGKGIQAIGFINVMAVNIGHIPPNGDRYSPNILVVCPASLKINWLYELEKWIVSPNLSKDIFPGEANIQVINYDQLAKLNPEVKYDLLIGDEAQYIKNPESKRTKLFMEIANRSDRHLLLTGTPILSHTVDLWPLVQICAPEMFDPQKNGEGFFPFAKRYCDAKKEYHVKEVTRKGITRKVTTYLGWSFKGATNLDELQEKLRSTCMVRRLKKDVLKELPPKRRQMIILPGTKEDADGYSRWVADDWDTAIRQLTRGEKIPFEEISRKRHEQGVRKLPAVIHHLVSCLEEGIQKIIVFAHHLDVLGGLYEGLIENYPVTLLTGATSQKDRNFMVDCFQNGKSRVFIGSVTAAGVGLTLTAASLVVFAEEPWDPATVSQAEDRAHRIGQKDSILVQHLVTDKTIDVKMVKMLIAKQEVADKALDRDTMPSVTHRAEGG